MMKTTSILRRDTNEKTQLLDFIMNLADDSSNDIIQTSNGNSDRVEISESIQYATTNRIPDDVFQIASVANDNASSEKNNGIGNNEIMWGEEWDAKEHGIDIINKAIADKLTVVITTYKQPICLERMILLMKSCPSVAEIRINWFEEEEPKFVGSYLSSHETPVIFDRYPNKISYRFHPRKFRTNAVFSVDVDTYYSCEALSKALDTFNEHKGEARAVGFHGRYMRTDHMYRSATSYLSPKFRFNTVFVTKGGITHKDMFDKFFSEEYKKLREKVDESFTAEDMLMSFIMEANKTKIIFTCPEVHNLCHVFCTEGIVRPLSARSSTSREDMLRIFVNYFDKDKVFRHKFEGADNIVWQKGDIQDSCKSIINYEFENTPPCTTFCKKNLICPSSVGAV